MPEVELQVRNMGCSRCVREVSALLRDVPGVTTLTADATTGRVRVGGDVCITHLVAAFDGTSYDVSIVDSGGQ